MINKDLIIKTIDIAENINLGTKINITKDDDVDIYEVKQDGYDWLELVCLTEDDAIWNDAENLEDLREELIHSAVSGNFQDIELV
jgi:hypothetical protein